ncbi:hypothetical protein ACVWYQ_006938 [Bradyrhizobium sp. USDA 3397]
MRCTVPPDDRAHWGKAGPRRGPRRPGVAEVSSCSRLGARPRLVTNLARAFPGLGIEMLAPGTADLAESDSLHLRWMRRHLGRAYKTGRLASGSIEPRIGVQLPDGTVIAGHVDGAPRPLFSGAPWLMSAFICVTVLGLWAARALTRPLSSFAAAAENFSLDGAAEPLPEPRPGGDPRGGARAQPHARADRAVDVGPHADAGRHQPRFAHADHAAAPARRVHRGREQPQAHADGSRPDARDAGIGAVALARRPQGRGGDAGRHRQHAAARRQSVRRYGPPRALCRAGVRDRRRAPRRSASRRHQAGRADEIAGLAGAAPPDQAASGGCSMASCGKIATASKR